MKSEQERHAGPGSPPEAWEPLSRVTRAATIPVLRFMRIEAASGVLLLVATVSALLLANSSLAAGYSNFWEAPVAISVGPLALERSLRWIVNDGLMVIFFFVVGLEIRREMYAGALATWRGAALPMAAAAGGMLVPALVYIVVAGAPETRSGWGVPMATDISFALGIFALLGKRVPVSLRVLLLAVAVIDDVGAILVIGLFYSSGVSLPGLLVAGVALVAIVVLQRMGVRAKFAYVVCALVAWAAIYSAGIHPTIAGVLVGLLTPVRAWFGPQGFVTDVQRHLEPLSDADAVSPEEFQRSLNLVDVARREALSPAESLIESLHSWVAFGIMPLFALANAGVLLSGEALEAHGAVAAGVALGLLVGKPVGVLGFSWLALKCRVAILPDLLSGRHLVLLGCVTAVGFTMSLFIGQIAFSDAGALGAAKLGVLAASGVAAGATLLLGRFLLPGEQARLDAAQRAG